MRVNGITQTIGFKNTNLPKKPENTKPEIETDKTHKNKRIANAKIDSNGIITIATHIENTSDSNKWYILDETGRAKICTSMTRSGEEPAAVNAGLKALYKYAYNKLSENNGSLDNKDALWIANRIYLEVYYR